MAAAPPPASASSTEITTNEGPVLSVVTKRLRALRKKLNRVIQMEEALSQGKPLNKEQEDTLRTKPSLLAGIDELEKLRLPLSQAVDQEIELASVEKKGERDSPDVATGSETVHDDDGGGASPVTDLLSLLYFGCVFDVKTLMNAHNNMLTRTHERTCCMSYDCVPDDDAAGDPLKESDLDLVAMLGGLLISRPVNSSLPHKSAVEKCVERAKLWLANSDQPIEPNSSITYAGLREKLNKIMGSDYFTIVPEIKAPVEVVAAAGGNYTFQVPAHDAVATPVSAPVPIEEPSVEYQKEEEQLHTFHANEKYDENNGNGGNVEEPSQSVEEGSKVDNLSQTEQDTGFQEHYTRKHYQQQNHRGGRGRRGGYGNGRGGRGGYHTNGRSQYYDQPGGGYQPRNNNNYRGRGGRGGMGPNHGYYAQEASS